MIKFDQVPVKVPEHVNLSEQGIAYLDRAKNGLMENEQKEIGFTLGRVVLANVAYPNDPELLSRIVVHLSNQTRNTQVFDSMTIIFGNHLLSNRSGVSHV